MNLTYRDGAEIGTLEPGQCVARWGKDATRGRRLMLWFYVARETDRGLEDFAVPVNPGGGSSDNGPGGRTWGLMRVAPGTWQVSPSINVLAKGIVQGPHPSASVWHQTQTLVNVPEPPPWERASERIAERAP